MELLYSFSSFLLFLMLVPSQASILPNRNATHRAIGPLGVLNPKPDAYCSQESGTFGNLEVTSCNTGTSGLPCPMYVGEYYEVSPIFTPDVTTTNLVYNLRFYPVSGSSVLIASEYIDGTFTAGRSHRVFHENAIPTSIGRNSGHMNVDLHDGVTGRIFICRRFYVTVSI